MGKDSRTAVRAFLTSLFVLSAVVFAPAASVGVSPGPVVASAASAPVITNFTAQNTGGQTVEISFSSSKSLQQIDVGFYNSSLNLTDFEKVTEYNIDESSFSTSNTTAPYHYTATHTASEDGNYTAELLVAKGDDGNNGASGEKQTVIVDTTPPDISNLAVTDDADGNGYVTTGNDVTVSATVVENTTSIDAVTANLSAFGAGAAEPLSATGGDTYETTITVGAEGAPTEGNHSVTVTATDTDGTGNEGNATTGTTLTVDTSTPSVSNVQFTGTAVQDGVLNDGDTFGIEAVITDGPAGQTLDGAQLTADLSSFGAGSAVVLTKDTGDTYTATATADGSAAAPDGYYNATVTAVDRVGQSDSNESGSVAISAPPDITAYSVTNPSGQNLTVSFDSSETLSDIEVSVSGPSTTTLTDADFTESSGTYTATWNTSTEGDFTADLLVANDSTDLNGAGGRSDTATVDTIDPSVTNPTLVDVSDGDGVVADGDDVRIHANVTDATSDIASVTFDARDFGWGHAGESEALTDGDGDDVYDFTATVNAANAASDGTYPVQLTATDADGNVESVTTSTLVLDTAAPTLTDVSITDTTDGDGIVEDGDTIEIRANSTDATSGVATVTADASAFGAGSAVTLTDSGGDTYTGTVTVDAATASGEGTYAVAVTTTDDGDNERTGSSGTLALNTAPPTITNPTVTDATNGNGVVADADSITVSATVTDVTAVSAVTANLSAFGAGTAVSLTDGDGDDTYDATVSVDDTSASPDGAYSVDVTATDEKAKSASATTATLTLDTTAPSATGVTISDDGDRLVADGDSVTVSVDVTDATTVGSVTANLSAFGAGTTVSLTDGDGDDTYDATVTVDGASASPDGNHSVEVVAGDGHGNDVTVTTDELTLDATPPGSFSPIVEDVANGDGVVGDGESIRVTATVSDATSGVVNVTANLSAFGAGVVELTHVTGDTYNATASVDDAIAAADGTHSVVVRATDEAGNDRNQSAGDLTLDTDAPVVTDATLTDATNGNGVVADGDSVTLSANVTDATTIQNVTADASAFGAGSAVTLTNTGGDRYEATFTVDGGNATLDSQSLTVAAEDAQGRTQTASTGSLTVDTVKPTISDVSLADDGDRVVGDGDDLTVTATVSDGESSIGAVTADLTDFGLGAAVTLSHASGNTYEATASVDGAAASPDGNHTVTVTVADAGSNTRSNTTEEITLDTTAPVLSNSSVTDATDGDGAVDGGDQLTLNVTVADDTALSGVTADASAFGAGPAVSLSDPDGDGEYGATVTVSESGTTDGAQSVTFAAVDTADNEGTKAVSGPTLDTTPPGLSNTSLTDATDGNGVVANGSAVTISADVTDLTTVSTVVADASAFGAGSTVTLSDADNDDTYTATITVDEAGVSSDGSHDVTVQATDGQGNTQTATTTQLTVDTAAPSLSGVSITDATDGDGTVSDGDELVVSATVSDATSSVSAVVVDASAFGAGSAVALTDGDSDGTYESTLVVDGAGVSADGSQSVSVTANDSGGTAQTAATGTLTLDTTPPATSGLSLTDVTDGDGTVGVGDTITVSVTVADATTSVDSVTVFLSDFGVASPVDLTDGDGDDTYETTVSVGSGASDGTQSVTLVVEDTVGNDGVEQSNTVSVEVDGGSGGDGDGSGGDDSDDGAGGSGGGDLADEGGSSGGGSTGGDSDRSSSDDRSQSATVVRVENATTDGRATNVSVGNPARNEPVAVDFGGEVATDGMNLTQLTVTTTHEGNYSLSVAGDSPLLDASAPGEVVDVTAESGAEPTAEADADAPTDDPTAQFDGVVLGSLRVDHKISDSTIDAAAFTVDLDSDRLARLGVGADELSLYRYHDGAWNRVETTVERRNDGTHTLRANAPGLSRFVVGVDSDTLLSVDGATLSRPSVSTDQPLTVSAELSNPRGFGVKKTVAVTANGAVVGTRDVTLDAGERATVSLDVTLDHGGVTNISVDGVSAGTVTVRPDGQSATATTTQTSTSNSARGDGDNTETEQTASSATPEEPTGERSTTATDTPGFGVVVAVGAVAVLAVVARVRTRREKGQ
ncbi:hypothetical protein C455_14842 [Haloferax larsenii JCM 13917]|nr:hypothetical protein [Haloferax larsenii]ELZ77074.1 hypothetical protein C455_14842 [Haloferax larsenii JCM 13917]